MKAGVRRPFSRQAGDKQMTKQKQILHLLCQDLCPNRSLRPTTEQHMCSVLTFTKEASTALRTRVRLLFDVVFTENAMVTTSSGNLATVLYGKNQQNSSRKLRKIPKKCGVLRAKRAAHPIFEFV